MQKCEMLTEECEDFILLLSNSHIIHFKIRQVLTILHYQNKSRQTFLKMILWIHSIKLWQSNI